MLADPTVCDQLLAGQVPEAPPPVQLVPNGLLTILSTSGQMIAMRREPGVVSTQSWLLPFGQPVVLPSTAGLQLLRNFVQWM